MQSPIPPPVLWHRWPSSCPGARGSCGVCPGVGTWSPSSSPWQNTHPWVHPSAASKSSLPPGQSVPRARKHHGPEPSIAAARQAGAERVPAPPYPQLWIRADDEFTAATSQPLQPCWVLTLRVAPITGANVRPHSGDPRPWKPWGHATLQARLSHPSWGWGQGTQAGARLSLHSPPSILCSSPVCRAQPSSQKVPVRRRLLHFPSPASMSA